MTNANYVRCVRQRGCLSLPQKMETYFTYAHLYRAYINCRKRKSNSLYCLQFNERLEENLLDLEKHLQNRTYRPGRSIAFIVQKPKIREIFAADFRDRVVHHLLYNYLLSIFEKTFIHDSYACRKGKGTHRARLHLQKFLVQLERESGAARHYYLQMDIKSFFTTIDQQILYDLVAKKVKNKEILWLTRVIIFHDCARDILPKIQSDPSLFALLPADKSLFTTPRGKGLPIGNLTSQFFANVYLDQLDQFVKHTLKVRRYMRYVDDFLIVGEDKPTLTLFRAQIADFVAQKLTLTIHPKKQLIRPVAVGIDFVGFIIRADYVLLRRRVVGEWRWRLRHCTNQHKFQQIAASYCAQAAWANTFGLRERICKKQYRI